MASRRGSQVSLTTSSIPNGFKTDIKTQIKTYMKRWVRKDVPSSEEWTNPRAIVERYCDHYELDLIRRAQKLCKTDMRNTDFYLFGEHDETPLLANLSMPWNSERFLYPDKHKSGATRGARVPKDDDATPQLMHDIYMAGIEAQIVIELTTDAIDKKCGTPGELAHYWPNLLQVMQGDSAWGGHASTWLGKRTTNKMEWPLEKLAARNMANSVLLRASLLSPHIAEDSPITWKVDVPNENRDEEGFYVPWKNARIVPWFE